MPDSNDAIRQLEYDIKKFLIQYPLTVAAGNVTGNPERIYFGKLIQAKNQALGFDMSGSSQYVEADNFRFTTNAPAAHLEQYITEQVWLVPMVQATQIGQTPYCEIIESSPVKKVTTPVLSGCTFVIQHHDWGIRAWHIQPAGSQGATIANEIHRHGSVNGTPLPGLEAGSYTVFGPGRGYRNNQPYENVTLFGLVRSSGRLEMYAQVRRRETVNSYVREIISGVREVSR